MFKEEKVFEQLIKDFHNKRSDKEISHSVMSHLSGLTNADPIVSFCKLLEIHASEMTFINGAEEIKDVQFKFGYFDPPHYTKMVCHIKALICKYGEKTLSRMLVFIKRRFAQLNSQLENYKKQYELAEKEIDGLASGVAAFVVCEACGGEGKSKDDNEELNLCWVCNGRGKVIQWKTKTTGEDVIFAIGKTIAGGVQTKKKK